MSLPDLSLVQRETQLLSNWRRKIRKPVERVPKPDQLAWLGLFWHSIHHMPKLA